MTKEFKIRPIRFPLREGVRYLSRGSFTQVEMLKNSEIYIWEGEDNSYTVKGTIWENGDCNDDLIYEVIEEPKQPESRDWSGVADDLLGAAERTIGGYGVYTNHEIEAFKYEALTILQATETTTQYGKPMDNEVTENEYKSLHLLAVATNARMNYEIDKLRADLVDAKEKCADLVKELSRYNEDFDMLIEKIYAVRRNDGVWNEEISHLVSYTQKTHPNRWEKHACHTSEPIENPNNNSVNASEKPAMSQNVTEPIEYVAGALYENRNGEVYEYIGECKSSRRPLVFYKLLELMLVFRSRKGFLNMSEDPSHLDIIRKHVPAPVEHTRKYWVNFYPEDHLISIYSSKKGANKYCCEGRIACVPITIKFKTGEGL